MVIVYIMAMTNESLAAKLHPFERKVLPLLVKDNEFKALVDKSGLKDIEVMRALQWLQNKDLVQLKEDVNEVIVLDKNGEKYLKEGMPEKRFLNAIKGETSVDQVAKDAKLDKNEINICLGLLKRKAAIDIVNDKGLKVKITDAGKGF